MHKPIIKSIPEISAIYYALFQNGYDYYAFEKDSELLKTLDTFKQPDVGNRFFSETRQSSCAVYPYWPRAAMLETAVFFLNDREGFRANIMSARNITDDERDKTFWCWFDGFPAALAEIMNDTQFKRYFDWENTWVERQNEAHRDSLSKLQSCLEICAEYYGLPFDETEIVVDPIKCVYSSDYHILGRRFICTSGRFDIKSVLHEYLHHIVRPKMEKHKAEILVNKTAYSEIDSSYYLSGDENGRLNAYEEHAVRALTDAVMNGVPPKVLNDFLAKII